MQKRPRKDGKILEGTWESRTFGDLVRQILSPARQRTCASMSVSGWVVTLDKEGRPHGKRQRAILRDITDSGLALDHPRKLDGERLEVTLPIPTGGKIQALLIRKASRNHPAGD